MGEVDVAHSVAGVGRFRINVFRQRGSLSLAVRRVVPGAPAITDLNLPTIVEKLAMEDSGLIVVAGPAASGKTTTVAALLDHVNATRARHIVTIEHPIEVLLADKQSLISQREIGTDAVSSAEALRHVGRQNADVIFVAEPSDPETVEAHRRPGPVGPAGGRDHGRPLGGRDDQPPRRLLPAAPAAPGPLLDLAGAPRRRRPAAARPGRRPWPRPGGRGPGRHPEDVGGHRRPAPTSRPSRP